MVEDAACAPRSRNEALKISVNDGVEHFEESDEVRLARTVGADENFQRTKLQVQLGDRFETAQPKTLNARSQLSSKHDCTVPRSPWIRQLLRLGLPAAMPRNARCPQAC